MCSTLSKILILYCIIFYCEINGKKFKDEKPKWAKKDIRDYNDADLERLLDQWEVRPPHGTYSLKFCQAFRRDIQLTNNITTTEEDEEPLEPDELPEHLRPQPNIDFSSIDMSNPENLLKLSKKGKTLMMFVSTEDRLTRDETEEATKLWQTGLWNNHIQAERYIIDDNRAIFMFKDGSLAWEAKDFLIEQENCKQVEIENKVYNGKNVKSSETTKKDEL